MIIDVECEVLAHHAEPITPNCGNWGVTLMEDMLGLLRPGGLSASSGPLRPLKTVNADCAAATARFVYNRQARRGMLVEFPACLFNRLICVTTSRRGSHDLFDANFGSTAVISCNAATHVALGDDADQLEVFCILNHRRAAMA